MLDTKYTQTDQHNNYIVGAEAIQTTAMKIIKHRNHAEKQIVLFTGSQSVLQALKN